MTYAQLRRVLAADLAHDRLVITRLWFVSRPHYAAMMGKTPHKLGPILKALLQDFDDALLERRVGEMTRLLEETQAAGTLPLVRGRVHRIWLHGTLSLPKDAISRNSAMLATLLEFEQRLTASGYMPKERRRKLEKLQHILRVACPLCSDGVTIASTALALQLGVEVGVLYRPPFKSVVQQKQDELRQGIGLRPLDVMVGGKVVAFSALLQSWPRPFVQELASALSTYCDSRANPQRPFNALRRFLAWLLGSGALVCRRVVRALRQRSQPSVDAWDASIHEYGEHCEGLHLNGSRSGLGTHFSMLNMTLRHLGAVGIFPPPSNALRPRRRANNNESPRPSVAEATRTNKSLSELGPVVRKLLGPAVHSLGEPATRAFLACLDEEFGNRPHGLPQSLPAALLDVIRSRLDAIQGRAWQFVAKSQQRLALGVSLLKSATLPPDFSAEFSLASPQQRLLVSRRYFPSPSSELAIAASSGNMLALVSRHFGGVFPSVKYLPNYEKLGRSFFQRRYSELGGRAALQSLLHPSDDAVLATCALYMVESGANSEVAREIAATALGPSESRGFVTVVGHKSRAAGKAIYADLPAKGRAVAALQWLQQAGEAMRSRAAGSTGSRMFVLIRGNRVEPVNAQGLLDWFKAFASAVPALKGLSLLPSMIRPSVLLKAALENDGAALVGVAIGQHGATVSEGYQARLPAVILRDAAIRRFLVHFETLVLSKAISISPISRYTAEEIETRVSQLTPTGLGTFCRDPYAKPGANGIRCGELDCAGTQCPQMEIVLTAQAAALMQIWKHALLSAAPAWKRDREERWLEVWLPWLCLLSVVEEKASRGPLLRTWDAGTKMRIRLEAQPGFSSPCPW